MPTCKVSGYIIDGTEAPMEGVNVVFIPAAMPAINSSTGKAIHPIPLHRITTSSGYFEINLTRNTDFVVIINSIGLKEKIRIPNSSEVNLYSLTGTYVSGDPTPTDPGGGGGGDEINW